MRGSRSGHIFEHEDAYDIRWTPPREIIEEGLVPFLEPQCVMFGRRAPKDSEGILERDATAGRYRRIVALAEERPCPNFGPAR